MVDLQAVKIELNIYIGKYLIYTFSNIRILSTKVDNVFATKTIKINDLTAFYSIRTSRIQLYSIYTNKKKKFSVTALLNP